MKLTLLNRARNVSFSADHLGVRPSIDILTGLLNEHHAEISTGVLEFQCDRELWDGYEAFLKAKGEDVAPSPFSGYFRGIPIWVTNR